MEQEAFFTLGRASLLIQDSIVALLLLGVVVLGQTQQNKVRPYLWMNKDFVMINILHINQVYSILDYWHTLQFCLGTRWTITFTLYIQMMDLYMVGMWLCHIPTLYHYVIFPPGGNMTGGNMLVGHDDDDDDDDDDDGVVREDVKLWITPF